MRNLAHKAFLRKSPSANYPLTPGPAEKLQPDTPPEELPSKAVLGTRSALETIKKDQTKQNKTTEDMMAAIKENEENIESKHKLVFAMFFWVVIALAVFAVTLRLCL